MIICSSDISKMPGINCVPELWLLDVRWRRSVCHRCNRQISCADTNFISRSTKLR